VVEVSVEGEVVGAGEGRSRREAETHAAEAALERLHDQLAVARVLPR
jgi:dsRNA-specific ribonuclease